MIVRPHAPHLEASAREPTAARRGYALAEIFADSRSALLSQPLPKVDAESYALRAGSPAGGDRSSSSGNTNNDDEPQPNTTIDYRNLSRLLDSCVRHWGQRSVWDGR